MTDAGKNDDSFDRMLLSGSDVPDEEPSELLEISDALRSYREQSLEWAHVRSATMPAPVPGRLARWLAAPQWALGTVAFCACVVGGALYTHHQAVLVQQAAAVLPAEQTEQALAEDNELLSSVNAALRGSVAPTERELGLTEEGLNGERAQERQAVQQRTN